MDEKVVGEECSPERITIPSIPFQIPKESSPDLFPSLLDLVNLVDDDDADEVNHFVRVSKMSAPTQQPSAGRKQQQRHKSPKFHGTGCCSSQPASSSVRYNEAENVATALLNKITDAMLTMFEKQNRRIDTNAVDVAKLVAEDRDRIRDLERRVDVIEGEQKMMLRRKNPAVRKNGTHPAAKPKIPEAEPKVSAAKKNAAGAKREPSAVKQIIPAVKQIITAEKSAVVRTGKVRPPQPCRYCGKVYSCPYVYRHQKRCEKNEKL